MTNGLPEDRLAGFTIGDGPRGVLTCHGFTGTPYEMRELAILLADQGYRVTNVHLAGHAQDQEALGRTRWPDWWKSLTDAYDDLTDECDRVAMVGLSMGGLLGLHLAAHHPLAGAAIMCAPIFLDDPVLRFVPLLKHVMPYKAKGDSDIRDPEARAVHPNCGGTPLACVESLVQFQRHVDDDLPEIRCPLFLLYSQTDSTVPLRNLAYVANRVASKDLTTETLSDSGHVITVDQQKQEVFNHTLRFLERVF